MEVKFEHFEDQKLFEGRIRVTELASEAQVGLVIDAYRAALGEIARRLVDDDSRYFGTSLSLKKGLIKVQRSGVALRAARLIGNNETYRPVRNPWKAVCPEFWLVAWHIPAMRVRIDAILDEIEGMLVAARQDDAGSDAYWEDETTGFGEPLVTLLALQDRHFVDAYRRLMNQWDMHHEFEQLEVIELIVRTHGICPETEQLLYDRTTISTGQNGEEQIAALMPLLNQAYGGFVDSPLFKRIVAWWHAEDMKDREEAHAAWLKRVSADTAALPSPRNPPPFHYCDNAELKHAAATLFAEMDGAHPLVDFLSHNCAVDRV